MFCKLNLSNKLDLLEATCFIIIFLKKILFQKVRVNYSVKQDHGPQHNGPQHNGPQHNGPQHNGPQHNGPQHNGPQANDT